ncbi:MAG: MmcQ/YjbR family DNA-binding protein [Betaproteobacteria bacterium]
MKLESLRKHVATLPGAVIDVKWGADECASVGGRMYAVFGTERGRASNVAFKVDAGRFLELTDRAGIVPAPYLARAHWVQVTDAKALSDDEARSLLERSYALVVAKLTRRFRDGLAATASAPRKKGR